jgi:hypothetical protein
MQKAESFTVSAATPDEARELAKPRLADLSEEERATLREVVVQGDQPRLIQIEAETAEEALLLKSGSKNFSYSLTGKVEPAKIAKSEFKAASYEEAKERSTKALPAGYRCTDLSILQHADAGFLGFGKKPGLYVATGVSKPRFELSELPLQVKLQYVWIVKVSDTIDEGLSAFVKHAAETVFNTNSPSAASADALIGRRRLVGGAVCVECPRCGTDFNRSLVLAEIRKQSPHIFAFQNWSTGFVCQVCKARISISRSSDDA